MIEPAILTYIHTAANIAMALVIVVGGYCLSVGIHHWLAGRRHSRTISRGIRRLRDEGVYPQEPSETAYERYGRAC